MARARPSRFLTLERYLAKILFQRDKEIIL